MEEQNEFSQFVEKMEKRIEVLENEMKELKPGIDSNKFKFVLEKKNSRNAGRKNKLDDSQMEELYKRYISGNITMKQLAKEYNVSTSTICNVIKEMKKKSDPIYCR